jgi:very-short-patch-repair endonuclease
VLAGFLKQQPLGVQTLLLPPSWNGVATVGELASIGVSPRQAQRLAEHGRVDRVRTGIYATPEAHPDVVAAARIGGRLAGASAATLHGLWSPVDPRLVVEVGRRAELRDPFDGNQPLDRGDPAIRVLWNRIAPPRRIGLSPLHAIAAQVLRSEPTSVAVAILDSMLRSSPMTPLDLEFAVSGLPLSLRRLLRRVDGRAESGSESIARCVLQDAGFPVEVQVRVPFTDLDRIDLVVAGRIAVECDSSFHDDPTARERDAARDLALIALGFVVVRARWKTIMRDPAALVGAVSTLARRFDLRESVAI